MANTLYAVHHRNGGAYIYAADLAAAVQKVRLRGHEKWTIYSSEPRPKVFPFLEGLPLHRAGRKLTDHAVYGEAK